MPPVHRHVAPGTPACCPRYTGMFPSVHRHVPPRYTGKFPPGTPPCHCNKWGNLHMSQTQRILWQSTRALSRFWLPRARTCSIFWHAQWKSSALASLTRAYSSLSHLWPPLSPLKNGRKQRWSLIGGVTCSCHTYPHPHTWCAYGELVWACRFTVADPGMDAKGARPPFWKLHVTGGLGCACVFSITASGTYVSCHEAERCNSEFSIRTLIQIVSPIRFRWPRVCAVLYEACSPY